MFAQRFNVEMQHVGGLLLHREATAGDGQPKRLLLCHFMSLPVAILSVRFPSKK